MADDTSVQARLQALAQEAVSVVMEADPAHGKELLGLFEEDRRPYKGSTAALHEVL